MYARFIMFTIGTEKRAVAEQIADQSLAIMQGLPGFQGATFLADDGIGEYGAVSLWASQADADAAGAAMGEGFQQAIEAHMQGPPTQRIFEVYEPMPVATTN